MILDWVPAHFPRTRSRLAASTAPPSTSTRTRAGAHPDWGTLIFNFGRNEVRNFLVANALFWLDEYHVDGLRVDAVASMLYRDYSRTAGRVAAQPFGGRENLEAIGFLRELNELVHELSPGVLTIAEESTAWPKVIRPTYQGGLGFTPSGTWGGCTTRSTTSATTPSTAATTTTS